MEPCYQKVSSDLPFMGMFLEIVRGGIIYFPSSPSQARKELMECFPSLEKKKLIWGYLEFRNI